MGLSEVTSKIQFQALIIQMFMQRRFEHAVIACRFYPNLFKDGDSMLQLDKDSGSNGDVLKLTIKVLSADTQLKGEAFAIESSLDGQDNLWFGVVGN